MPFRWLRRRSGAWMRTTSRTDAPTRLRPCHPPATCFRYVTPTRGDVRFGRRSKWSPGARVDRPQAASKGAVHPGAAPGRSRARPDARGAGPGADRKQRHCGAADEPLSPCAPQIFDDRAFQRFSRSGVRVGLRHVDAYLSSSPWMRGAPHSGLICAMARISARIPRGTSGRPCGVGSSRSRTRDDRRRLHDDQCSAPGPTEPP
jgi:hypothetical protein